MRICIEESTYEGTPIEILTQLRALHFDAGTFDGTEGYIRYMQNTIRRMTEQPCELPEGCTEERAAALIHVLGEIGALELLEQRMDELGLNKEDYGFYLDLRKYGSASHAGFGLGFERCVMYLTGMGNIRDVIPFPRTVKNCEL